MHKKIELHLDCQQYKLNLYERTSLCRLSLGKTLEFTTGNKMAVVLLISGSVEVTLSKDNSLEVLRRGEMCSVTMHSQCYCKCLKDAQLLLFFADSAPLACDQVNIASLSSYLHDEASSLYKLEQNDVCKHYAESVQMYIEREMYCQQLNSLKIAEFFSILRIFYDRVDLSNFLRPLVKQYGDFKSKVTEYSKVCTTTEQLAVRMNMGKKTFERRFKEHFDTTPKRWLISNRMARVKAMIVAETDLQLVADTCGFASPAELARFCKRYFGVLPDVLKMEGALDYVNK